MGESSFELVATNLSKTFPGVQALKDVDMILRSGEIHALVGANGAGKSTFAKILSGVYTNYEGKISINGRDVYINSPTKALEHGISTVYQEVDAALVPYFTVAENLFLVNKKDEKNIIVSQQYFTNKAESVLKKLNIKLDFDINLPVNKLSVAEKQLLLIAKALIHESKFIIFDEPTSSLGPQEIAALFEAIRFLKTNGVGILYISHRMPEVFEIADKISVLRDGEKVGTFTKDEVTVEKIVKSMLGDEKRKFEARSVEKSASERKLLEVLQLHKKDEVGPLSFYVREGEILGITGLVGAGKSELVTTLYGARSSDVLDIKLEDIKVNIRTPKDAIDNKIYFVPEERRKQGLILNEDVEWNFMLPNFREFSNILGMMKQKPMEKVSQEFINELGIKCFSSKQKVGKLSGGNQQKVVVGRWLIREKLRGAKVIIFDEPTVGIDVGAKEEIYKLVEEIANDGHGVIFVSSDIDEVLRIADRIIVMYKGKIEGELDRDKATSENILTLATGGHQVKNNIVKNNL